MSKSAGSWQSVACLLATGFLAASPTAIRTPVQTGMCTPRIAFASQRDGNWEIYLTNVDGTRQTRLTRLTQLTHSPGEDDDPALSSDGSRIVFWSDRDVQPGDLRDARGRYGFATAHEPPGSRPEPRLVT